MGGDGQEGEKLNSAALAVGCPQREKETGAMRGWNGMGVRRGWNRDDEGWE